MNSAIPESSIRAWMSGKVKSKKLSPPTVLSVDEEAAVVQWCEERQNVAHCVSIHLLKGIVEQICKGKSTPF